MPKNEHDDEKESDSRTTGDGEELVASITYPGFLKCGREASGRLLLYCQCGEACPQQPECRAEWAEGSDQPKSKCDHDE